MLRTAATDSTRMHAAHPCWGASTTKHGWQGCPGGRTRPTQGLLEGLLCFTRLLGESLLTAGSQSLQSLRQLLHHFQMTFLLCIWPLVRQAEPLFPSPIQEQRQMLAAGNLGHPTKKGRDTIRFLHIPPMLSSALSSRSDQSL